MAGVVARPGRQNDQESDDCRLLLIEEQREDDDDHRRRPAENIEANRTTPDGDPEPPTARLQGDPSRTEGQPNVEIDESEESDCPKCVGPRLHPSGVIEPRPEV